MGKPPNKRRTRLCRALKRLLVETGMQDIASRRSIRAVIILLNLERT